MLEAHGLAVAVPGPPQRTLFEAVDLAVEPGVSIKESLSLTERVVQHSEFAAMLREMRLAVSRKIAAAGDAAIPAVRRYAKAKGLDSIPALLVSRIVHPFGLDFDAMRRPARLIGALGTLGVNLVAAVLAGWQGIVNL